MGEFRFLHTSDLHLGRRFSNLPEDIRGRLVEARHTAIEHLSVVARERGARHVLVAGDLFDTETPSDRVWRQAVAAMGAARDLHWWIIPGNHDSLSAESLWTRFQAHAPEGVHLIHSAEHLVIAEGVTLLPAPATRRFPGRDLTEWMQHCVTEDGHLRIGLAHGGVLSFASEDEGSETIALNRATSSGLDYLALGDWHGYLRVDDRTYYSGTPERDRFKHTGRGECLSVSISGPGAIPQVERITTGVFDWPVIEVVMTPEQDAVQVLHAALPQGLSARRNTLLRVRASGWLRLAARRALEVAADAVAPEFGHFEFEDEDLQTECAADDLDAIARGGALRIAADQLYEESRTAPDPEARAIAAAALRRLYSYVRVEAQ